MCLLLFQHNTHTKHIIFKRQTNIRYQARVEFHKCNWRKPDTKCQVPKKAGTRLRQYLWLPLALFIPSLNCSNPEASLPYSWLSFPYKPGILAMSPHDPQLLSWSLAPFSSLLSPPPLLLWQGWEGSVWTLPEASGNNHPLIYKKTLFLNNT